MNREILFRGKSIDDDTWIADVGDWVYGGYIPPANKYIKKRFIGNMGNCTEVNPETIGQYTGLTDRNGVRIFEGDIIEALNGNRGYVVFENGAFMKSCNPKDMPFLIAPDVNAVIGNRYDNPELMKGEENENNA